MVPACFLKRKEELQCRTSPKRDVKVEEEGNSSSSFHTSSSHGKLNPKDKKQRYNFFVNSNVVNSNVVHDGKQHAYLNNALRKMFPCTFFLSSNHCVDKCDKGK